MAAECFGGEETSQYSGPNQRSGATPVQNAQQSQQYSASGSPSDKDRSAWKREKTRNAFMLVYDRVMPESDGLGVDGIGSHRFGLMVPVATSPAPQLSPNCSSASDRQGESDGAAVKRRGGKEGSSGRNRFRAKVPAVFMKEIRRENLEFWRCVTLCFIFLATSWALNFLGYCCRLKRNGRPRHFVFDGIQPLKIQQCLYVCFLLAGDAIRLQSRVVEVEIERGLMLTPSYSCVF